MTCATCGFDRAAHEREYPTEDVLLDPGAFPCEYFDGGPIVEIVRQFDNGVLWLAISATSEGAAREAAAEYGTIREADETEDGRYSFAVDRHLRREDVRPEVVS
jgi:hypothetical protein